MVALLVRAARDLEIHGLVAALVARDQFLQHGRPFGVRERVGNTHPGQAVVQPFQVVGQPEQAAAIDGDDLVDAVTEQETAIEYRDVCLFQRQETAIQPGGGHSGCVTRSRAGLRRRCVARTTPLPRPAG